MRNDILQMTTEVNRGALIVFEGCDRSGKTTQASSLQLLPIPAKFNNFS